MNVLHFITNYSSTAGPIAASVQQMMFSTCKMAETHLLTCTLLTEEYKAALMTQKNIRSHYLKPLFTAGSSSIANPMLILEKKHHIKKLLKEIKPDIVHIHGSWDYTAALVEHTARHAGYITIVSPHRGLSPAIINIDFWKKKLPRLIAYQIWMVFKCVSVIAVSEQEAKDIRNTGLKKRIETLPSLVSEAKDNTETTPRENLDIYGAALVAAYRKAMDSMYYRTLTKQEKDFVALMVKSVTVDNDVQIELPTTQGLSLRRIFFYAYDEDVLEMMLQGVQKMQITIPPTPDIAAIPRYKNRKAKRRGPLSDIPMPSYKVSIPESNDKERDAVGLILKSKKLTFKRLTLRHFVELYTLFRHTDFDEDIVKNELKRIHRKSYTKKLQRRLHEMFSLKDGYDIF